MPKFAIGVGEEFPAGDPPASPPDPEPPRRRRGWHIAAHILLRLAGLALVIALIAWIFHGFAGPYAWHGPYADGRGYFFFPFFPLLLVLLLILALRRRHYYGCGPGMWRWQAEMRRWHDEMHREHENRI